MATDRRAFLFVIINHAMINTCQYISEQMRFFSRTCVVSSAIKYWPRRSTSGNDRCETDVKRGQEDVRADGRTDGRMSDVFREFEHLTVYEWRGTV